MGVSWKQNMSEVAIIRKSLGDFCGVVSEDKLRSSPCLSRLT